MSLYGVQMPLYKIFFLLTMVSTDSFAAVVQEFRKKTIEMADINLIILNRFQKGMESVAGLIRDIL